jgi:CrcB protein
VFLAGGVGASLRVALVPLIDARLHASLPSAGTWIVNMIGCLAIGLGASLLPQGSLRPILLGGLLGGFTTYSAFGLLTYEYAEQGRYGAFALQVLLHVAIGLLAVGLGLWVGKQLAPGGS